MTVRCKTEIRNLFFSLPRGVKGRLGIAYRRHDRCVWTLDVSVPKGRHNKAQDEVLGLSALSPRFPSRRDGITKPRTKSWV